MDLSKSLPGFSFPSDAPKAASVCRNLRNYLLLLFFFVLVDIIVIIYHSLWITCLCRFIAKSCRIFNS